MRSNKKSSGWFERSINVLLFACLTGTILEVYLHCRPAPSGKAYVMDIWHYLPHAIFYEWYGLALISIPFLAVAYLSERKFYPRLGQFFFAFHVGALFFSLFLSHADHEIQRFIGMHLSVDFLRTYGRLDRAPIAIGNSMADDAGNIFVMWSQSIFYILFVVGSHLFAKRRLVRLPRRARVSLTIVGLIVFYILPFLMRNFIPGGILRQVKVKPPIILVYHELKTVFAKARVFPDIGNQTKRARRIWQQRSPRDDWAFWTRDYPFFKRHKGECPRAPNGPWNFILLQLETFRAKDMQLFNPSLKIEPTPFIDNLARESNGAFWPRFYCNGLPTVNAFMAIHTGIYPHSVKRVATAFTPVNIDAIPAVLRRHGYYAVFITGSDPDWDSQRLWANRWYDKVIFDPSTKERDRDVFRQASTYLKERKWGDKPFLATLVSISNHLPFRSPEPGLDITNGENVFDRLHNTMRYTDDVVREFIESIRQEPWFEKTIVIITGDHAYDLGDRGEMIGHSNLRHESTWVPLIISGNHPRLPRGEQEVIASHIDIAPSIMELAGVCDDNSFMGHSLIGGEVEHSYAITVRNGNRAFEDPDFSAYLPQLGDPMVFSSDDMAQEINRVREMSESLKQADITTRDFIDITDYAYENARIAPQVSHSTGKDVHEF
jgi:arylsulfatase A-like enzyme